jgi:hypothetical protein
MDRLLLSACALASVAFAQESMRARLRSIEAPIRHAGVYHVATGRGPGGIARGPPSAPRSSTTTPARIVYWVSQQAGVPHAERFQHRSRVPSPSGPSTPSVFHATGYDEAPGCASRYVVDGSRSPTARTQSTRSTTDSSSRPATPPAARLDDCGRGLRSHRSARRIALGGQWCWVVDVDLQGSGQSFVLQADGDGTYTGPSTPNNSDGPGR